jgi:hypothetical protein
VSDVILPVSTSRGKIVSSKFINFCSQLTFIKIKSLNHADKITYLTERIETLE